MSIPEDWELKTIEELCIFENHRRIPISEVERAKRPGKVPYYGANGQKGVIDVPIFDEDLILIAEDGGHYNDFRNRAIAYRIQGPSWVNNHAHVVRAKDPEDQNFIFYALEHKDIRKFINGGTRGKLNKGELQQVEIAFPNNPEERRYIGERLQKIDEILTIQQDIVEKYKKIKLAMMDDLLSGKTRLSSLVESE